MGETQPWALVSSRGGVAELIDAGEPCGAVEDGERLGRSHVHPAAIA